MLQAALKLQSHPRIFRGKASVTTWNNDKIKEVSLWELIGNAKLVDSEIPSRVAASPPHKN